MLAYFRLLATRKSVPTRPPSRKALLWFIGTAEMLCAAHVFSENICTISSAEGPSMTPTLPATGSWLLINCLHRRGRDVRVGDLVAYRIPIFAHSRGVKRVIGMPGDYVLLETPGGPNPNASMIQVRLPAVSSSLPLLTRLSGARRPLLARRRQLGGVERLENVWPRAPSPGGRTG